MEEIQERVLAQLDKDELVAMVRDLASIPSPTGSEAEVADLPGGPVPGTRPAGADAGGRDRSQQRHRHLERWRRRHEPDSSATWTTRPALANPRPKPWTAIGSPASAPRT